MPFEESLAAIMSDSGIPIEASAIPDRDTTLIGLQNTQFWFDQLEPAVRDGFDEGTEEFAICHIVAGEDIAVAPQLAGIFEAFDQVPGFRFSQLLAITQEAAFQAEV